MIWYNLAQNHECLLSVLSSACVTLKDGGLMLNTIEAPQGTLLEQSQLLVAIPASRLATQKQNTDVRPAPLKR